MAETIVELLTDVADAIREKKGTSEPINAQSFAEEIRGIETSSGGSASAGWTGHADVEGLKAIGWDDEDIAYYQKHGVNWNAEDDEYHKVSDDNKALYGVLTASNISSYKDRIVYLPKIDFSGKTSMASCFNGCYALVAIPMLNTSNVTNMENTFFYCTSLVSVPLLNTKKVRTMFQMFKNCSSLVSIPQFETSNVENMNSIFNGCTSLNSFPLLNTDIVNNMSNMFSQCYSLVNIPYVNMLNILRVGYIDSMFSLCKSLVYAKIKNLKFSISLSDSPLLNKESLLYIINNEAAESAITIKLASYAYERLANDADILEALANHPNISLAK